MSPDNENREKAQFFFELAQRTFTQVSESNARIDQKIYNTLSLTTALAPLLLGLFYYLFTLDYGSHTSLFAPVRLYGYSFSPFSIILFSVMVGISLFSVAAIQGFRSYKPWLFKRVDPVVFRKNWGNDTLLKITKKAAGTISDVTSHNWKIVMDKGQGFHWTLRFLAMGVAAFLFALVVLVFSLLV